MTFEIAPGVVLTLAAPAGVVEEPEASLPPLDVSAVPGARVALKRGMAGDGLVLRAACAGDMFLMVANVRHATASSCCSSACRFG